MAMLHLAPKLTFILKLWRWVVMREIIVGLLTICALAGCVQEQAPVRPVIQKNACYIDFATDVIVLPEGTPICRSIPLSKTQDDILHYNPTHGRIEGCGASKPGISVRFEFSLKDYAAFVGKVLTLDGGSVFVAIGPRTSA